MRTITKFWLCCCLAVCLNVPMWGQPPAVLVSLGYGPQLPLADLDQRFGGSWSVSGALDFLPKDRPIQFGLQGNFFFGTTVEEDVLSRLRTDDGFIIGNDRSPADIQLRMRGLYLGARIGTMIPLGNTSRRRGLALRVGGGYLQHRIRIQDDPVRTVNQLVGGYRKGYDRLTSGPALYQFVGYQQVDVENSLRFFIGIEAWQGFTSNQREWDFALNQPLNDRRFDALVGVRIGWILPFYLRNPDDIYY